MFASATTRMFIATGSLTTTSPSKETTSTLVLTTPTGHFVDTRIFLSSFPSTIPRENNNYALIPDGKVHTSLVQAESNATTVKHEAVDWAFAGTSKVSSPLFLFPDECRCTWHHTIDSRTPNASAVKDNGSLVTKNNDGVKWELEYGTFPDGTEYLEGWLPIPVNVDHVQEVGLDGAFLRTDGVRKVRWIALNYNDEAVGEEWPRGMVVRVGDWAQGIVRVGPGMRHVALTRWFRRDEEWRRFLNVESEETGSDITLGLSTLERACRVAMEIAVDMPKGWKVIGEGYE